MLSTIFSLIILVLWILWARFAINYTNRLYYKDLKYLLEADVNVLSQNSSAARYDQSNLNIWETYFGCIFLLPVRVIGTLMLFIFGYSISLVVQAYSGCKYFHSHLKFQSPEKITMNLNLHLLDGCLGITRKISPS